MRPTDIKVGKIYVNRGAGRTQRKVLAIGNEYRPKIYYDGKGGINAPDEPGVLYMQAGKKGKLYLSSFVAWCSREVM